MSLFKQLVGRGNAVIREWHDNSDLDDSSRRMIAELSATTLVNLCGDAMKDWTPQEREEKVNAVRIALTSAYQIGKHASTPARRRKNRKSL